MTIDTSELAKEIDRVGGIGRQIVIAVVLVGLLIGTAIATSVLAFIGTESAFWEVIFRTSYFVFIFAMIVAIVIVIKLVWSWIRGKPAM